MFWIDFLSLTRYVEGSISPLLPFMYSKPLFQKYSTKGGKEVGRKGDKARRAAGEVEDET